MKPDLLATWLALGFNESDYGKVRCPCIDHEDRNPSAVLYEDYWHCFACGRGGDAYALIMESRGVRFKEAKALAEQMLGGEIKIERGSRPSRRKPRGKWTPPRLRR